MAETTMVGGGDTAGEQGALLGGRDGSTQVSAGGRLEEGSPGRQEEPDRALFQRIWGFEGRTETQGNKLPAVFSLCSCIWETKQKVHKFDLLVLSVVGETKSRSVQLPLSVRKRSKIGTNNSGTHRWMGKVAAGREPNPPPTAGHSQGCNVM